MAKTDPPKKAPLAIDPASLATLPGNTPLNERQGASYLGMSVHTLRQWRFRGVGPEYLKLGTAVRYRKADLDNFMERASVRPQA